MEVFWQRLQRGTVAVVALHPLDNGLKRLGDGLSISSADSTGRGADGRPLSVSLPLCLRVDIRVLPSRLSRRSVEPVRSALASHCLIRTFDVVLLPAARTPFFFASLPLLLFVSLCRSVMLLQHLLSLVHLLPKVVVLNGVNHHLKYSGETLVRFVRGNE